LLRVRPAVKYLWLQRDNSGGHTVAIIDKSLLTRAGPTIQSLLLASKHVSDSASPQGVSVRTKESRSRHGVRDVYVDADP
jgi:hypothetical protein